MDIQLKGLVTKLVNITNDGNVTLAKEKATGALYEKTLTEIIKYEEGQREKKVWAAIFNEYKGDENLISVRFDDLSLQIEELVNVVKKTQTMLTQMKTEKESGSYNVNDLLKKINIFKQVCETIILTRITSLKNSYPGLIDENRRGSMILNVMLIDVQINHALSRLPKDESDFIGPKMDGFFEYTEETFVRFIESSDKTKELVTHWQAETLRLTKVVKEMIEEVSKTI